jgi:hypothetical protein
MVVHLSAMGAAFPGEAILKIDALIHDPTPESHYDLPKGVGFAKEYVRFQLFKKP